MKVVIVGGVAGGASAAARLRRLDEDAEITIFERTGHISYANCALPYFAGEVISNPHLLTLQTPEGFHERYNIDARVLHEVTRVNRDKKTVAVRNLETGDVFEEPYDVLVLATGAKPLTPNVTGMNSERIFTVRTVEDALAIDHFIRTNHPRRVAVVGGGFIGTEMTENLRNLGLEVTLLQRGPQMMPPFDPEMAAIIHNQVRENGVRLLLRSPLAGFEEDQEGITVRVEGKPPVRADFVILSAGVLPDTALAREAGLAMGLKGAIRVDEHMRTSDPSIYAVGDAVQIRNSVTGEEAVIELAGPANREGRIAADNICGRDSSYPGSQGSTVLQLFGLTCGATGVSEKLAARIGLDVLPVWLHPLDHASSYPGSANLALKVLFDKNSGLVVGAQCIGTQGVDKHVDVLATAIRARMRASDLAELDLSYAPPYSTPKDPVNYAGFIAQDVIEGLVRQLPASQVDDLPRDGSVVLLDVRTPAEYHTGHADGFLNVPVDELRQRVEEIPQERPVYAMCEVGLRGYVACRVLRQLGFDATNVAGGYRLYDAIRKDTLAS